MQPCLAYTGSQVQHQESDCSPTQSYTYDELLPTLRVGNHPGEGHSPPQQRTEFSNRAYFDGNVIVSQYDATNTCSGDYAVADGSLICDRRIYI